MTIGTGSAETDDEFLFDCFIHYPPVEICQDVKSPAMIVAGRTGAGKTAIFRHIKGSVEHAVDIDPSEMAMSYASNSDVLNFLQAIGADLDLFFQILWKHVLCIEYIRLRWSVQDEQKSLNVFAHLAALVTKDARKQRALNYLREWEGRFWITMDQNIKEITESYEGKISAEMGGEIQKFKAGGRYEKRMSTDRKSELVARARRIMNADQLAELASVIDLLAEYDLSDKMNKFYILVDRLDERWVDASIRFRLIRALIESLKAFKRITNLKILVALRTDILERVVQETSDLTFQREKFEDYFVRLKWSRPQLKSLVDKRMDHLFKRQYSTKPILFDDVFTYKVGNQSPFDYIVDRTFLRPRDVIAFVNECIKVAEGEYEITASKVRRAELEFSRIRRDALEQEWKSAFPTLGIMIDLIAANKRTYIDVSAVCSRPEVEDLALAVYSSGKQDFDPLFDVARNYVEAKQQNPLQMICFVLGILYRVGAVGLKLRAGDRYNYSHLDQPIIPIGLIDENSKVGIHPMLHAALRLER